MAVRSMFTHLTFGLLEGWWLYEDPELRISGCPGLYPETWRKVLGSEGFKSVIFPAQEAHSLGHQTIVAQSDEVIRQRTTFQEKGSDTKGKKQPFARRNPIEQTGRMTDELLREKSTAYIIKLIGETLKIPVNKIDPSDPLENYGIDSIIIVQLTNTLRKVLENVSSTLFFECQTIDAVVEHFIKTQRTH